MLISVKFEISLIMYMKVTTYIIVDKVYIIFLRDHRYLCNQLPIILISLDI